MDDMTRRGFLAAGAVVAAPYILRSDDKAGTKNPIIGEGEHKYECIHDWGQLPSNIKYGNTHSVVEDSQGHIYVHHTVYKDSPSPDSVVVFDEKGKFVRSFGPMFRGGAHGLFLNKEGRDEVLYFCDEKHGIITKRTLKGEEIWTMGYPQDSPIYQKGPGSTGPGRRGGSELPADELRHRAQRRFLGRRWLRLLLHVPLQPEREFVSQAGEHVRRSSGRRGCSWRPGSPVARAVPVDVAEVRAVPVGIKPRAVVQEAAVVGRLLPRVSRIKSACPGTCPSSR